MNFTVCVADGSHSKYAEAICEEIYISSLERRTGIAKRTPEYIIEKMDAGKAVIALTDDGEASGVSGHAARNEGRFRYSKGSPARLRAADLGHTHPGSIGNLCNAEIASRMAKELEW